MRPGTGSRLRREDGAAAVEFAIIVSLLFVVIFGIMEYGVAFLQMQSLRSGAREGARIAAVRGTTAEVNAAVVSGSAGAQPTGYGGAQISGTCTSDPDTSGTSVKVTIPKSSLPANVEQALSIDIPFLPPINLNPDLSGTFRCE